MEKGGIATAEQTDRGCFLPLYCEPAPLKSRGTFLSPHPWSSGSAVEAVADGEAAPVAGSTAINSPCPRRLMPCSGHLLLALRDGGDWAPGPAFCRLHGETWHLLFGAWMGKGDALIFLQPSSQICCVEVPIPAA